MLFSRVYNWIKYKTLPPSILFLNRLFVERDSKHRRVTSNLGLTFRSSKWSTYARVNVNLNSKTNYFQAASKALVGTLLVFGLYAFTSYYLTSPLFNYGYPLIWFLFDADLYLKVAFSSSLFCTLQLLMSSLQGRLLNSFDVSNSTESLACQSSNLPVQIPKRLHRPVLYAWLTSSLCEGDISNMFNVPGNLSSKDTPVEIAQRLYQLSDLLSKSTQSNTSTSALFEKLESETLSEVSRYAALSSNVRNFAVLEYLLLGCDDSGSRPSYFRECSHWSLDSIQRELGTNPETLKTLEGLFYSTSFSYSKLNGLSISLPETSGLRHSVEDQLSAIRWNRWLYKYNILHRASLKNTMYLTSAKKLLSSGFYGSSLSTNNIWAASTISTSSQGQDVVRNLTQAIYGDFSRVHMALNTHIAPNPGFYNSALLGSLGFYELSYHWFMQRFYQFNTLNSNRVVSMPAIKFPTTTLLSENIRRYESSKLGFSLGVSQALTCEGSVLDFSSVAGLTTSPVVNFSGSDVYLHYNNYSTLTKQRVEVIRNLTSNPTSSLLTSYAPTRVA